MPPDERSPHVIRTRVQEHILSSTTSYYYYTLPGFALNANDAREAAEATCSTWTSSLCGLDVLCGRADSMVAAPACERSRWPPLAASGSCWAAPVLWLARQPLWATLVSIGLSY